jgi:hypothetical protein
MNTNIKVYPRSITPEDAVKFLEKNSGNRKMSDKNVTFLSEQMKKGDWKITADPIKFGKDGRLLDGQHRLQAVVKYGKAVEMFVAENVDDSVFAVLDTGKNRSAGDVLSTQGFKNANSLSGAVRAILLYNAGYYSDSNSASRTAKATNAAVLKFVERNPEIMEVVDFVAQINRQFKYISLAPLTMLYWTLSKKNQQQADAFFGKYATGIELTESSPIRLLRDRLIRDGQNKTKLSTRDKVALFIYAWNAFITRRKLQQLTLAKNYQFPKPL